MPKKSLEDFEVKWRRFNRYWDLIFKYWDINRSLWNEFPERMSESTKRTAELWLDRGLVKCKHER